MMGRLDMVVTTQAGYNYIGRDRIAAQNITKCKSIVRMRFCDTVSSSFTEGSFSANRWCVLGSEQPDWKDRWDHWDRQGPDLVEAWTYPRLSKAQLGVRIQTPALKEHRAHFAKE